MTETKPHINLLIATPGNTFAADYVKSLVALLPELIRRGMSWGYLNDYASHVGDSREITLSGTKANEINNSAPVSGQVTYDKILWIDSDIAFTPEDVFRLYDSDKDIISGAYLFADGSVAAYKSLGKQGYQFEEVKALTEVTEIEGCGFGFVCVKAGVFEQLSRPWFQQVMGTVDLNGETIDFPIMGEDLSWCKRVKDKGFKIYLDPQVKVTHHKTYKLTWEGLQA